MPRWRVDRERMTLAALIYMKDRLPYAINFAAPVAGAKGGAYYNRMSLLLSRIAAFAVAVVLVGTAATASARPKKPSPEPASTAIMTCDGTPIIMQGLDCKKRPAGGEEQTTKRTARRPGTARGSGSVYAPAPLSPPSLGLPQQSAAPYIPPPVSNPSAQINQLNHSFPLDRGLGNNPTDRDAYIRYNMTR